MKNVSDKSCTENQNTHFMFNNFLFSENRAVYETMSIHALKRGRPQLTIQRMRIECRIPTTTNTHSEYVTRIAFLLQQRLHERA